MSLVCPILRISKPRVTSSNLVGRANKDKYRFIISGVQKEPTKNLFLSLLSSSYPQVRKKKTMKKMIGIRVICKKI